MTTAGLYKLLINDGKQDQMLLATELLNNRLKEIERIRCKHPGIIDKTPTLVDIEKTHILFMTQHFKPFVAIGYEYQKSNVFSGIVDFNSLITFSIPQYGDFFNDMVFHIILTGLAPGPSSTQVNYCDYLGHRFAQQVNFKVNDNYLDQYTADIYNFHYNYRVLPTKKISWNRCVGQEVPSPVLLTLNEGVDEYREVKYIVNGLQTPKATQTAELWIPLLFWFNLDPKLMIPSVAIPYGQRFIELQTAPIDLLATGVPTPDFTAPTISTCEMYINNIFVNPEIHDIFIKRIGFNLIRVYRYQTNPLVNATDNIRLDSLRWPVEVLYFAIQPVANLLSLQDWNKYYAISPVEIPFPVAIPNPTPPPVNLLAFSYATYKEFIPTVDTIGFNTHGITIFDQYNTTFYRDYLTTTYGDEKINSPEDQGMLMAVFCLYPGAYQPSGYINLSRSREFFVTYTSSYISAATPCNLIVIGVAINFLLISEGTAVLRYNT